MSDYGDIAGADTYHAGNADWTGLTTAQKTTELNASAAYMDSMFAWKGIVTVISQDNAWPRARVYDLESRLVDSATIPTAITNAFYEVALVSAGGGLFDAVDRITSKSVTAGAVTSSKSFSLANQPPPHGDYVDTLVRPYVDVSYYVGRA